MTRRETRLKGRKRLIGPDCTRCIHPAKRHCERPGLYDKRGKAVHGVRTQECVDCECEGYTNEETVECPSSIQSHMVGRKIGKVVRVERSSLIDGARCPVCGDWLVDDVTRDLLMFEVKRSLRETFPERAGRLIAELERRIPMAEPPTRKGDPPTW